MAGSTNSNAPRSAPSWHAQGIAQVLEAMEVDQRGLTADEAAARLATHGRNELPSAPPVRWWTIALRQFRSPLIYILALAALISLWIHEYTDASFIAGVLVLNAIVGGIQEWKAERSSRALQKLLKVEASVARDGEVVELDAEQLVPGDIVRLESGDRIPADMRLLSAHGVEIDEALLTGESLAVHKQSDWTGREDTALADRVNMAWAGATVVRGRAKGVVVATGRATHVGQLAIDVMASGGGAPPLLVRLERFTRIVGIAVLIAAAMVGVFGVVLRGQDAADMFIVAVALAVSAIPEGLPVAITVALAVATNRMAGRGVIVRKLSAVEGLGSCTLIATDKTGTLTCNELTVQQVWLPADGAYEVTGSGFAPEGDVRFNGRPVDPADRPALRDLARAVVLCNEAGLHRRDDQWHWRGDPTDVALLALGVKLGMHREASLDAHRQVDEIPFEPEHRFAASFHEIDGQVLALVKGAPERVLSMCDDGDGELARQAKAAAEAMAGQGMRVLAVAQGEASVDQTPPAVPSGLTFLGLVGMIDPLRPGVQEAVAECHQAGLRVCMVTGDHPLTARAIGRQLGLVDDAHDGPEAVVVGSTMDGIDEVELDGLVKHARIFARVSPHMKLRIVKAAQRLGHFVAVTGDGVNDAPALREANVGVAMGRSGTDVAREAAELVISDDNFATIVAGVEEGRIAYNNIRNVVYLLVSTGAAEVVMVLLAVLLGYPLPLLPVQLLWLNLVTNGIQGVALAFEPGKNNELRQPPRAPTEPIFNRLMIERTIVGVVVMGGVAFAAFAWLIEQGWSEASARNMVLLLMVLFENVHIGNCRSETVSALRLSPFKSPFLLAGAAGAFGLHVVGMYLPLGQRVLSTESIGVADWVAMLLLALTIFVAMELHKWMWAARRQAKPVE